MLKKYPIDPAINIDLAFAYQPFPVIDISKLPILNKHWLDDLQTMMHEVDDTLPNDILNNHLGDISNYCSKPLLREQLQLIFHRLQGNLDAELGALSSDNLLAIISKLTEEIKHCSEGFHNRVNIIVDSFYKPNNIAELLCRVRKNLVEEVAFVLLTSTDSEDRNAPEVHAWNRVHVVAAIDGLGVNANFSDPYVGALSDITIRHTLQQAFYKKFTPFRLPCSLIGVFMEFIPELEVEKKNKNGLSLQMVEKITSLIKGFFPNYINETPNDHYNWKKYFEIVYDKNNPSIFRFDDIKWEKMYQCFYQTLSDQNYFKNPQINSLADCAYYNLFLRKKSSLNPAKLICRLFKSESYAELLEQLVELKIKFPKYYKKECKLKITAQYCLPFIEHLRGRLKISSEYCEEIMLGFQLILHSNFSRNDFIIGKIADAFLLKNQSGLNLLMLAAQDNPALVNDILVFLKTHETTIDPKLIEKMFSMKNKENYNALMLAASKPTEAIATILSFLTTHISRFANDTLRNLFTQQQTDSYTAVTLSARDHPEQVKSILSFITDHIKIDAKTINKLLFTENSKNVCTALMLAVKNQADATFSILKFISNNIENFDPKILEKIFLEKDQDGFTILMLASRYQPKALEALLDFISAKNEFISNKKNNFFPHKNLTELFTEKNSLDYNCLMLAAEFQPISVPVILNFIKNNDDFEPSIENILFTKNQKGCNSMLLARHHPAVLLLLINFIRAQPEAVIPETIQTIFLKKHRSGLTLLMYLARDKAQSLALIFKLFEKYPELVTRENLHTLITEKNERHYNSLMLAARNQYDAAAHILNFIHHHPEIFSAQFINQLFLEQDENGVSTLMIAIEHKPEIAKLFLNFIQNQPEVFSPMFLNQFLVAHDKNKCNALMVAATHHANVVELLLTFLSNNIKHISKDTLQNFVFKSIHDKDAANAVFFGGRYDYKKTVLSVIARLEDHTAIHALLGFIDKHIELLGIEVFANLLREKDNKENYIFQPACSKYPFIMKKVLNFMAHSVNNEELIPIQNLSASFILDQFARWTIASNQDQQLFNKVINNCSALLLIHFNKDYFAEQPKNLKLVTDKLLDCYLEELVERQTKKIIYTTRFKFFGWRYTTTDKMVASLALKEALGAPDLDKGPAMMRLKEYYPALSNSRLGNLFAAYQAIDNLKPEEADELGLENDPVHFQSAKLA